jgi:hypothetical protein
LKQAQAPGASGAVETPSEFKEITGSQVRGGARNANKEKPATTTTGRSNERRQTTESIATEADGSWARKTLA